MTVGAAFGNKEGQELLLLIAIEEIGENLLRKMIGKLLSKNLMKTVNAAVKKGMTKLASMNMTIAKNIAKKVVMKAAMKIAQKGALKTGAQGAIAVAKFLGPSAACPPCAPFFAALALFQLATMIFDMWDPFGCNNGMGTVQNMGKSHVKMISRIYNEQFTDAYLSATMKSAVMPNGRTNGRSNTTYLGLVTRTMSSHTMILY
jgi:hypothetical protein